MRSSLALSTLLMLLTLFTGCVPSRPETPYPAQRFVEPTSGTGYSVYVPSYYSKDRDWPVVIPLHGTYGFDSADWQVTAWKDVAERHGLIIAAPDLKSVQGILPVVKEVWHKDLDTDERMILNMIDDLATRYHIDRDSILLTGFSAGGYPMYYTGLRNPQKFNMLIAAAANCHKDIFAKVTDLELVRQRMKDHKLHIVIVAGRDDLKPIQDQSWEAYQWLRSDTVRCYQTRMEPVQGGHLRRTENSYQLWSKFLPERHRM